MRGRETMFYLGVDIGSLSCDAVVMDDNKQIISSSVVPTGARNGESIARAVAEALNGAGISEADIAGTVSTGYGRDRVEGRLSSVTEITCHAQGIQALIPDARVLVDIGGQDSKAIRLGSDGRVMDFAMNDKCAAGTGRFLEAMARALQVDIEELAVLDEGAKGNIMLSSMCTVFAESEVVSLIARSVEMKEIVRGLNKAIASRTLSLVKRVAQDTSGLKLAMSGGVARNKGVVHALSEAVGLDIVVPPEPDIVGAYGAAIIAREQVRQRESEQAELVLPA